jgi:homoserine dehydrogenase
MGKRTVNIVLMGLGNVGKAFVQLLEEKAERVRQQFCLDLCLRAVFKSGGGLFSASPIRQKDVYEMSAAGLARNPLWRPGLALDTVLHEVEPGVMVECTFSDLKTGEPGLRHVRTALENGWHVVTANKGPLAVDFKGLKEIAGRTCRALRFSGAAAAALPALDVGLYSLAGTDILSMEGILNGTSNYILTRMAQGSGYSEALREAQAKGIAEPDPSLDVEGWDTAVKLLLLANAVMGLDLCLKDMKVEGIKAIPSELLSEAKKEGQALKLLGKVSRENEEFKAGVFLSVINRSHPLFGVNGTNKGVTYSTDGMGVVTVTGGKSDPCGAAAALLKDIINIYRWNKN